LRRNTDSTWHRLRAVPLLLAALAAALTATLFTPGVASATQGSLEVPVVPVVFNGVRFDLSSTLPGDLGIGDCVAQAGSNVELPRPNILGGTTLTWNQTAYSRDPSSGGDIWHGTFNFYGNTNFLFKVRLDGPPMKNAGEMVPWTRTKVIGITWDTYDKIDTVVWVGDC
jgi:hypothetical protein